MGFFGSGKINRQSTDTERALESSHTSEQRDLYAANNLNDATDSVRESTRKGWSVNPFGSDSTDKNAHRS